MTVAVVCSLAAPAAAQAPPEDAALAETLFRAAKKLMAERAYAEACPKLVESQRLDPGGGTLLTLALCHEVEGKTASAWVEFKDALTLARRDGRADRISIAAAHARALEAGLSRLTVQIGPAVADTPGLEVRCDDLVLARAAWGIAIPVDPGAHRIVVTAPGKESRTMEVAVRPAGAAAVDVALLEDTTPLPPVAEPAAPRPPPPKVAPASRLLDGRGIAGITLAGAGIAVIAGASYLGARAFSLQSQANSRCPFAACTDPDAVRLNGQARTAADLSTAGFVAGGGVLAGAVLLVFLPRPRRATGSVIVAPVVARSGTGLVAVGAW